MPPEPFWLQVDNLYIVPVCHYRMEFAREVRRAFLALQPDRVALELPQFLAKGYLEAVSRFPQLTTLVYQLAANSQTMLVPVEPTDAFAEAVRSGQEARVPVHFLDLPITDYGQHDDPIPDSASLSAIGLKAFWEKWQQHSNVQPDAFDARREAYLADGLRMLSGLNSDQKILVVLGLTHVQPILRILQGETGGGEVIPPPRSPVTEVALYQPSQRVHQLCQEMPFVIASYEMGRGGSGPDWAWEPPPRDPPPEPEDPRQSLRDLDPNALLMSLEAMLRNKPVRLPPMPPEQRKAMSRYLQGLTAKPAALFSLLTQFSGTEMPPEIRLPKVSPPPRARAFTYKQVEDRRGELAALYSQFSGPEVDRHAMQVGVLQTAAGYYHENTGDTIAPWQFQVLTQFLRNYARVYGRLLPNLFQLAMGARGVADDNYTYEVQDLGAFYPWAPDEERSDLPLIEVEEDDLILGNQRIKTWTMYRTVKSLRQMPVPGRRAHEKEAGEWAESFEDGGICSFPPEDLVIEDYARYLQKRAIQQVSLEKSRVEPFSTSLLDGIDMRETLRNWHERKLFVREVRRVHGGVGAVIVVFDEDKSDRRYPWRMTWHGEHSQESDMAFYATPYNEKIVGPGIARAEYGGILMTYPNRQLPNVWDDSMYEGECRTKSEYLLMAALEYAADRHVVYVAAEPPRSNFRSIAARLGKRIVYLPIGSLSPQSIKRIRVFHVLSGHQVRAIAKDYIW